jgi:uridine kinase
MILDEKIVNKVLNNYGFTLEDLYETAKHKVDVAEQDWIYLTHHMHPPKKASEMETLHHCVMWEKKNEKGLSWEQAHVKDDEVFQHILVTKDIKEIPTIVYDHLNNKFKAKIVKINKKEYVILNGLKNLKRTKWSDQDRGSEL